MKVGTHIAYDITARTTFTPGTCFSRVGGVDIVDTGNDDMLIVDIRESACCNATV